MASRPNGTMRRPVFWLILCWMLTPVAATGDDNASADGFVCPEAKPEVIVPRRPGRAEVSGPARPCNPGRVRPPHTTDLDLLPPVPDRWRIVSALGYAEDLRDPYSSNNWLKGDRPIWGEDWFVNLLAIADTVVEPRRIPTPVGAATTDDPGQLDTIGDGEQFFFQQNLIIETVIYKGDTVFKPPDWEFRFTPVFNYNYTDVDEIGTVKANPNRGKTRSENFLGIQALFVDKHLRNVSDRYDFDSIRVGIQPFSSDFRGFLFQDNQFGVRLFGNRDNNIFQYNLAWFRLLEKDANSGLNDITSKSFDDSLRDNDVFTANVYWQDFPKLGFFSQASVTYNRNREQNDLFFDDNGILQRPASIGTERGRDYDVVYLGYNGDGHFGRSNLTTSFYYAYGDESRGTFVDMNSDIRAWFAAAEYSMDFDWARWRVSALHGSGDDDPFDDQAEGFDAIFENPQFAGADTSYWVRQNVPLIGGGIVTLSPRNGILNSLRSSKEFGQSNFTNPGITLLGIGADFDLTPRMRLSFNANQLWFDETATLEVARNQGSIDEDIGQDLSLALIYRPKVSQNIVLRLSGAVLIPGDGYEDLFGDEKPYSILGNFIFQY